MRLPSRLMYFALLAAMVTVSADAVAAPGPVREVYFNGVKLDASVFIKSQTFTGCDVKIDDKGDIYITAKGYNVVTNALPTQSTSPPPPPPPPPAPPPAPVPAQKSREPVVDLGKKGVWLVSKQTQRGIVQYDVDVFVNGGFVRKVKSVEDPVVFDITRWIRAGKNEIRMVATKNIPDRRMSLSPTDTMEIIVGEGVLGGTTVNIDRMLIDFTRTAQETEPVTEDYSIGARSP